MVENNKRNIIRLFTLGGGPSRTTRSKGSAFIYIHQLIICRISPLMVPPPRMLFLSPQVWPPRRWPCSVNICANRDGRFLEWRPWNIAPHQWADVSNGGTEALTRVSTRWSPQVRANPGREPNFFFPAKMRRLFPERVLLTSQHEKWKHKFM